MEVLLKKRFYLIPGFFFLCAVVLMIFALWFEYDKAERTKKFDQRFATGQVEITGFEIGLGESGKPKQIDIQEDVPITGFLDGKEYHPSSSPRTLVIFECESFLLGEYSVLYLASKAQADVIAQMPSEKGGPVSLCASKTAFVIVWFK